MPKHNFLVLLLVISSGLLAHIVSPEPPTKPTPVDETCNDYIEDYDYDSQHSSNVRALIKELKDQAFKTYFYNSSAGSGEDKVYGQYYCRTDLDSDLCGQCISEATKNRCIGGLYVVVWYEECTLFYDRQSIVGVLNNSYSTDKSNTLETSTVETNSTDSFVRALNSTTERIILEAAYSNGSPGLATGEGVVSDSETVYCLVQCSPDLKAIDCKSCLLTLYTRSKVKNEFDNSLFNLTNPTNTQHWASWMSLFSISCQLRYSNYDAFYRLIPASVPSPKEPHFNATKSDPTRRGKNTSYYVVRAVIAIAAVIGLLSTLGISFCLIRQRRKVKKPTSETGVETTDFVQFDLKTIEFATNNFSVSNKLGEGGFGIVYQGMLNDGQGIAVKRLSKGSAQGTLEFRTEVAVLAKLQHKNLVQLIGCCVDGEERLLVYEFLSNLSLDRFLSDMNKSSYLTWEIRHKIIQGIARGLHYLHEDLRVKIVHRDLKTSNILLDDNLDPKIADFGMARLVKVDQTSSNTTKVVGTYGYISPEYALAGRYSTKSDVYSFGVIVLEILSGKNNNMFYDISHNEGLLQYAWRVWNEGAIEQLIDPIIQKVYSRTEAERCLQIGLLCVQDDATCRPTMHAVLIMLESSTLDLPPPLTATHYNYVNKVPSDDGSRESISKQQEYGSGLSSTTFSAHKDLNAY